MHIGHKLGRRRGFGHDILGAGEPLLKLLITVLAFASLPAAAADRSYVGLAHSGTRIEALSVPGPTATSPVVLLVGGLNGKDDESVQVVNEEVRDFEKTKQSARGFGLLAIPVANPDGNQLTFPPSGVAYRENSAANALWRWIGVHAPDFVLIVGSQYSSLADALSNSPVAGIGAIPARVAGAKAGILKSLPKDLPLSPAHIAISNRRARLPQKMAEELAQVYGHDFDQVTYLPGMALIGQMRLGHVADVQKLAEPYASGAKDPLGARPSSLTLAGHLVFAELAQRTKDPRYTALVRRAADLGFTESGEMKEAMPFHDEMSDSVFMGTSILVKAGKLTGERKYFDMAARHLAFMAKLDLRPDGLYRHSPLTDAAWARGNAFPALGLTLALTDFPKDHPQHDAILLAYRQLMSALAQYQDAEGMWHEVIDEPGSYAELSATSMIGFAMLRGVRNGWLDRATYQPRVDKAWRAVEARVGSDGTLIDVCESTNKQMTVQDYLWRASILGMDPRGGGMALLFATEMAGLD
jgi:rhamnogalacturonyl hydrolase YesR